MILKWVLLSLGLLIIFGSHIYMLLVGLPADQMMAHAAGNLVAGVLILISAFMKK